MTSAKQNIQSIKNIPGITALDDHGAEAFAGGGFEVAINPSLWGAQETRQLGGIGSTGTISLEGVYSFRLKNLDETFGDINDPAPGDFFSVEYIKRGGKRVGKTSFVKSFGFVDDLDKYKDKGAAFAKITQYVDPGDFR